MVHHGYHVLAGRCGLAGLVAHPLERRGLDASGAGAPVDAVATALEPIVGIAVAVDAYHHIAWQWLAGVAQRGCVAPRARAVAAVAVEPCKLVGAHSLGRRGRCAVVVAPVGAVDVVVARYHQHLDASLAQLVEVGNEALVAHKLAVLGEVAGHKHQPGLGGECLPHELGHDGVALHDHAHVATGQGLHSLSLFPDQRRGHEMRVGEDQDVGPGCCHALQRGKSLDEA